MNKTYFRYLCNSRKHLVLILFIVNLLLTLGNFINYPATGKDSTAIFAILTAVAMGSSIALPGVLFSFVHKRKSADSYFALPVSRKDILETTIRFMELVIIGLFTLSSLIAVILVMLITPKAVLNVAVYLVLLVLTAVSVCTFVRFTSWLYMLSNSIFDGIVTVLGYLVLPFVFAATITVMQNTLIAGYNPIETEYILDLSYLYLWGSAIYKVLKVGLYEVLSSGIYVYGVFTLIHLVISYYGLKKVFIDRDTERAEHISDDKLCYPFLLTAYSVMLCSMVTFGTRFLFGTDELFLSVILYVAVFIAYTVFTFIYRRKIRITLKSVVIFVITILATSIISLVGVKTKGFGLSYIYPKDAYPICVEYYSWGNDDWECDLTNLLKQKGIRFNSLDISFSLVADQPGMYKDVLVRTDNLRKEAIAEFYKDDNGYRSYSTNLVFYDNYREYEVRGYDYSYVDREFTQSYNYNEPVHLSLNDLMEISKVTDVNLYISYYSYDEESSYEENIVTTLSDLMADNYTVETTTWGK